MYEQNDTAGIEIRQAERPGQQPPGGLTKGEKQAIKEMNKQLEQLGRRICNTCGVEQELEQGYSKQDKGRSYFAQCKKCANAARNERRRSRDGLAYTLERGYHRAKDLDLPAHKIARAELLAHWNKQGVDPWKCLYTGVELVREPGHSNSRTVDHVQPLSDPGSAGHVLENLAPCSNAYNNYKRSKDALSAMLSRNPERFPGVEYPGPVDSHGNPLLPARVEWSDGTSAPVVVSVDPEGKQVLE